MASILPPPAPQATPAANGNPRNSNRSRRGGSSSRGGRGGSSGRGGANSASGEGSSRNQASLTTGDQAPQTSREIPNQSSRRAGFGGQLSESVGGGGGGAGDNDQKPNQRSRQRAPKGPSTSVASNEPPARNGRGNGGQRRDRGPPREKVPQPAEDEDLATRLTWAVSYPPWPDCAICFNSIHAEQPIWSCVPSQHPSDHLVDGIKDDEIKLAGSSSCWGIFHLKCISDWASRSVKDFAANPAKEGSPVWRCPGCQTQRRQVPNRYECYCRAIKDPKPPRLFTPHSCAQSCSRKKMGCDHPCPLSCHPGPCPPCSVSMMLPCGSHQTSLMVRCSHRAAKDEIPSCGEVCKRQLGCGNAEHVCLEPCHAGPCAPCPILEEQTCFCSRSTRSAPCGSSSSTTIPCSSPDKTWLGSYSCLLTCFQEYDCGIHQCSLPCHPHPSSQVDSRTGTEDPNLCPFSPKIIWSCPCGAKNLKEFPNDTGLRTKCTDPVKTCKSICGKSLDGCEHTCKMICHNGPCMPCEEQVVIPCRCAESKITLECHTFQETSLSASAEILCERVCRVLRSCKKHECGRACCPLAWKAKSKGKRRELDLYAGDEEESAWHECQLVCGKMLSCGNHSCPAPDHTGRCPPCLEASYDELICNCGRTVIPPPISCGKTLHCTYPCARPAPPCGHPKASHACHETSTCPPCIFLTTKTCACGKAEVKNVRCSQEKVSCGMVCGEILGCGWHRCEKPCHSPGECEKCTKPCGKPLKICGHPCQKPCHSPAACDQSEPCPSTVIQSCACGRMEQQATCGACLSNSSSREDIVLKCIDACEKAKRNERLAAALGISKTRAAQNNAVEWPAQVVSLAITHGSAFLGLVEKALEEFVTGSRMNQILPYMPPARRDLVIQVAELYRVETTLVDQDPVRSVQLRRKIDSRIPSPLLSAYIAQESARRTEVRKPLLNTTLRPSTANSTVASASSSSSVSAPKPKPWGATPIAAGPSSTVLASSSALSSRPGSGVSTPATISRSSSPYVPPALRKPTGNETVPAASTTASADVVRQSLGGLTLSQAPSTLTTLVPQVYRPPPVTDDDEWEKSDEE
ncbi:Transcription factor NF-X1, contains NFX-type Zn2-binding and R3H domains [Phaffia rhodozyma]|uniref:Transcription factor NF-X1, contains NFX-type Zn2-binding and R3H domains n=1 Tax=Phaffia rhodozyma TaxID=264483 RepID=A0A0F7SHB5_PHARH|nr:Transcription factor NF-X1, contains NFX-type Zn2-binding and R3H domains [Phaffia rhodozyma]